MSCWRPWKGRGEMAYCSRSEGFLFGFRRKRRGIFLLPFGVGDVLLVILKRC